MTALRVVVIGGGAAGALTTIQLARRASGGPIAVTVVEPAGELARGTAFATRDPGHLLNVPAAGMSAHPDDAGHFLAWRTEQGRDLGAHSFAPRGEWGDYLAEQLDDALEAAPAVTLDHVRRAAVSVRAGHHVTVVLDDGHELVADALVVATGLPSASLSWAPAELLASDRFVVDPWAPGALVSDPADRPDGPGTVLVVGTGLTMIDVVTSLTGASAQTRVVAVSRSGQLPERHTAEVAARIVPDVEGWGPSLDEVREAVRDHVRRVVGDVGDWRPAIDGVRPHVARLWASLSDEDRREFLARDASRWNRLRHRIPLASAEAVERLEGTGVLEVRAASVVGVATRPDGDLDVALSDGTTVRAARVVNCTTPTDDVRLLGDSVLTDLLTPGDDGIALAQPATEGMGFVTEAGRLVDTAGRTDAPVWVLGALRRGELWESTAIPEIREQAADVADAILSATRSRGAAARRGRRAHPGAAW